MPNIFKVQGFGALSEWNGEFSSASADQAFQAMASLGSNSIADDADMDRQPYGQ